MVKNILLKATMGKTMLHESLCIILCDPVARLETVFHKTESVCFLYFHGVYFFKTDNILSCSAVPTYYRQFKLMGFQWQKKMDVPNTL